MTTKPLHALHFKKSPHSYLSLHCFDACPLGFLLYLGGQRPLTKACDLRGLWSLAEERMLGYMLHGSRKQTAQQEHVLVGVWCLISIYSRLGTEAGVAESDGRSGGVT
jgi:hypothetical protein